MTLAKDTCFVTYNLRGQKIKIPHLRHCKQSARQISELLLPDNYLHNDNNNNINDYDDEEDDNDDDDDTV